MTGQDSQGQGQQQYGDYGAYPPRRTQQYCKDRILGKTEFHDGLVLLVGLPDDDSHLAASHNLAFANLSGFTGFDVIADPHQAISHYGLACAAAIAQRCGFQKLMNLDVLAAGGAA
jgi:hypothetical protein